jgi:hypothetical protein
MHTVCRHTGQVTATGGRPSNMSKHPCDGCFTPLPQEPRQCTGATWQVQPMQCNRGTADDGRCPFECVVVLAPATLLVELPACTPHGNPTWNGCAGCNLRGGPPAQAQRLHIPGAGCRADNTQTPVQWSWTPAGHVRPLVTPFPPPSPASLHKCFPPHSATHILQHPLLAVDCPAVPLPWCHHNQVSPVACGALPPVTAPAIHNAVLDQVNGYATWCRHSNQELPIRPW